MANGDKQRRLTSQDHAGGGRPEEPARPAPAGRTERPEPSQETVLRGLQRSIRDYQDNPWLSGLFRPLLISLVATSFAAGLLALVAAYSGWRLAYALPMAWLMALEGVYSTRQLGRPDWRDRRGLAFRLAELALLLVVVRVAGWTLGSGLPAAADLALWLRHPSTFFDGQFLLIASIALAGWALAVRMTVDFLDLALQPDEILAHEHRLEILGGGGERAFRLRSRSDVMAGFTGRWIWAGIVLVFVAAAMSINPEITAQGGLRMGVTQAGLPPATLAALLVYFVAGLILISEGRLAVLRGGWYNQDVPVAPDVLRRWQGLALATLLLAGLVAALLPIGSTGGMANGLSVVLGILIQVFYLFLALLIFLVGLALLPFRFLLQPGEARLPSPTDLLRQIPNRQQAASRLPDWLGGAVFWLVVAVIVGYLLFAYARAHGLGNSRLGLRLQRLRYWWRARWARLRERAEAAGALLRARVARLVPPAPTLAAGRPRLLRPGALPPRARVRYFYLSTVRRAAQEGMERPAHKTPREFAQDLRAQFPDAELDVEALTDAFIDARYNDRPIPAERARSVQPVWQRVMRTLRRGARRRGRG